MWAKSLGDYHLAPLVCSNNSQPESFDTYVDMSLPPGLLEVFLSDIDDLPTAEPAPPCLSTQAKSNDDVEM